MKTVVSFDGVNTTVSLKPEDDAEELMLRLIAHADSVKVEKTYRESGYSIPFTESAKISNLQLVLFTNAEAEEKI